MKYHSNNKQKDPNTVSPTVELSSFIFCALYKMV